MLPRHVASNSGLKLHNCLKHSSQVSWSSSSTRFLPSHTVEYASFTGNCCSSCSCNFFAAIVGSVLNSSFTLSAIHPFVATLHFTLLVLAHVCPSEIETI